MKSTRKRSRRTKSNTVVQKEKPRINARGAKNLRIKREKRTAEQVLRIVKEAPDFVRSLNPPGLERHLDAVQQGIRDELSAVRYFVDRGSSGIALCTDEADKTKIQSCLDICDSWLTDILCMVSDAAVERTKVSNAGGLIGVTSVCCGLGHLPEILKRMPESEWEGGSDGAGFMLLDGLRDVIRFVENDALQHPRRYRFWAQEQPFFPMMVFRNLSGYRRRFDDVQRAVELGKLCPINTESNAQYHFDVPLNVLVFESLLEFVRVFGFLNWSRATPSIARVLTKFERLPEEQTPICSLWQKFGPPSKDNTDEWAKILAKYAGVPAKQAPIFLEAYDLPQLSKAHADKWAKLVIRYLESEYPDWNQVPELRQFWGKKGCVKSTAKVKIAQAVHSLARV